MLKVKGKIKADMKSNIPLETAAILFLANLFLKQGITKNKPVSILSICTKAALQHHCQNNKNLSESL